MKLQTQHGNNRRSIQINNKGDIWIMHSVKLKHWRLTAHYPYTALHYGLLTGDSISGNIFPPIDATVPGSVYAHISFNGKMLTSEPHEGMFLPFQADITRRVRFNEENHVAVLLENA